MTTCTGSNQPPPEPRSPVRCPDCGQEVRVYMRRLDWTNVTHLYVEEHEH